jgi:hypothetical protein
LKKRNAPLSTQKQPTKRYPTNPQKPKALKLEP